MNIVVSLVPVGPRDKDVTKQCFALHLSAAFEEEAVDPSLLPLIEPWKTEWDVSVIRFARLDHTPPPTLKTEDARVINAVRSPRPEPGGLEALQKSLIAGRSSVWKSNRLDTAPKEKDLPDIPGIMDAVHTLSLYPGGIPDASKILWYFDLPDTAWVPKTGDQIAAVPELKVQFEGSEIMFRPRPGFDMGNWPAGWEYEVIGLAGLTAKAFVKPLTIQTSAGGPIYYDVHEAEEAKSAGLKFDSYWLTPDKAPLWMQQLEEFVDEAVNCESFVEQVTVAEKEELGIPNLAEFQSDLRLMFLATLAQWHPVGASDLPFHEVLIKTVADEIIASEADLQKKIDDLTLKLTTGDIKNRKDCWLSILRQMFQLGPDMSEVRSEVLRRRDQTPRDFDQLLFHIWDFAVLGPNFTPPADPALMSDVKRAWWNYFHQQNHSDFIEENFSSKDFRLKPGKRKTEMLKKLSGCTKRDEAATTLSERAKKLFDGIGSGDFVPLLTEANAVIGQSPLQKISATFIKIYTDRLKSTANLLISADNPGEEERKTEAKPGGISLKFGPLEKYDPGKPQDNDSAYRKIAGIGVLVRKKDENWHLATAATLDHTPNTDEKPLDLLSTTALVPMRVAYKNGVRFPFLTYNQRSLVAPTALARAVKDSFTAVTDSTPESIFRYGPPKAAGNADVHDFYKLVPLRFGSEYEMAAFMIDTAFGVPKALQNGAAFKFFEPNGVQPDVPEDALMKAGKYWRKVPVGQVRVSAFTPTGEHIPTTWPEVPDKVFPIAWEIDNEFEKNPVVPNRPAPSKRDLALLYRKDKPFIFGVKPPSVDIDVLERWLPFATPLERKNVIEIMKGYFKLLNLRQPDSIPSNDKDLSIDDPAVENFLFVLEKYNFKPKKDARYTGWQAISFHIHKLLVKSREDFNACQLPWQTVLCKITGSSVGQVRAPKPADVQEKLHSVVVDLPETEVSVFRLRIMSLVSKKFLEGGADEKFSHLFFDDNPFKETPDELEYDADAEGGKLKEHIDAATADHICIRSHHLLLETPNDKMPDEVELWKAISLEMAPSKDLVDVSLAYKNSEELRNVIKFELRRQQWRWQGRPIEAMKDGWAPVSENKAHGIVPDEVMKSDAFLEWEMASFAGMSEDFDLVRIPIPYSINAPRLLHQDSFKSDIMAGFVRYGLESFSRYEGLFSVPTVTSVQSYTSPEKPEVTDKLSGTGWKRALVRYRGDDPAKPVVHAVIPLTQGFGDDDKSAALMVVLDQTAYEQCGITEKLECELTQVIDSRGDNYNQIGPDPIRPLDHFVKPTPVEKRFTFELTGAYGHTFDTGARQPLFASSSYIINPKLIGDKVPAIGDWDFAKIRLRRLTGTEKDPAASKLDDWTDPLWVQFPPSSDFARGGGFQVELSNEKFSIKWGDTAPATDDGMRYGILITSRITDFRGQHEHENYFGWVVLDANWSGEPSKKPLPQAINVRLVEVQVTRQWESEPKGSFVEPPSGDDFWRRLLRTEDNTDNRDIEFRITRMSKFTKVS